MHVRDKEREEGLAVWGRLLNKGPGTEQKSNIKGSPIWRRAKIHVYSSRQQRPRRPHQKHGASESHVTLSS